MVGHSAPISWMYYAVVAREPTDCAYRDGPAFGTADNVVTVPEVPDVGRRKAGVSGLLDRCLHCTGSSLAVVIAVGHAHNLRSSHGPSLPPTAVCRNSLSTG
jgi:hypothetical protein